MSDIDFDELDKAVNSLVGDDGPKVDDKSQPNEAPKVEEPIKKPETTSTPSLPSRRAGRFMDMKHESPIMNKASSSPSKPSVGVSIKPINDNVEPEVINNNTESNNTTSSDSADQSSKDDTIPNETETKLEETDAKKDDDKDDDKKPSPFIDDAKVEKRPLGGSPSDNSPEPVKDDDKKDPKSEEELQTPPEPVELPPELDKNLVAIEAGEAPESAKEEVKPEEEKVDKSLEPEEELKKDSKEKNESEDSKDSVKNHKEEISQLLASAAGGSIPDQYKRENRSHELHTPHPLFDADHHKDAPVSAPKKPKSKALVVFNWIFIGTGILLGGASLGAAVFYFASQ